MAKKKIVIAETVFANGRKLVDEIIKRENERNPNRLFELPDGVIKLEKGGLAIDIDKVADWEQALKKWHETPLQLENTEAEWITQIRDYCKENKILPTHLIEIHKEWTIREQKYNQTFKTEKAPE